MLFADDCTLLTGSEAETNAQLGVVANYCAVSGARLNVAKCKVLALNQNRPPPTWTHLSVVATGVPVRYLGVQFGHKLSESFYDDQLVRIVQSSLLKWGKRGRTLIGRTLLVKSKVLSQIWYHTVVTPLSVKAVTTIQRMIRVYILGAKYKPNEKHHSLLEQGLQYDKWLGLGLPHVQSHIQAQRVRRLQRAFDPRPAPWKTLVLQSFDDVMPGLLRPGTADILWHRPGSRGKWLSHAHLSKLTADMWNTWSRLPWTVRAPCTTDAIQLLQAPVWFNDHPLFRVPIGTAKVVLARTWPHRLKVWIRHFADHGFHSLQDFIRLSDDGKWPSEDTFTERTEACLWSFDGPEAGFRPSTMYHRLSSIAQGVWQHYHVPWDQPLSSPTQVAPVWPMSDIHGKVPFHAWSKEHVKYMCVTTPQRKKPHPMITPDRPSDEAIIDYLKRVRRLRPWGMPVQYDVWFRAMMNILPTGSKYRFMETNGPDATKCPYARCQSLETPRHVLHDCICVRALWQAHRPAWRQLGVDLSWDMCMDIDLIEPPAHLANLKETIVQLASSLIMIVVHKLWMHRNTVVHQDAGGPQIAKMVYETVVQWSGFVRTALRDPDRPLHSKVHITTIVALLCEDNTYAEAQANNDNIFSSLALPRRLPRTLAAELDALN